MVFGESKASHRLKPENAHALNTTPAGFGFRREVDLAGALHTQI
jgi:hypothetical protein